MKKRIRQSLILLSIVAVANLGLAVMKLYAGITTNSLCILLDATNSFLDILTSGITIIVFALLLSPNGKSMGRAEYVAGFLVSIVTLAIGAVFFYRAFTRLAMAQPVWFGATSCALISVALVVKIGIAIGVFFANKKINSKALKAISLDSILDVAMTAFSLISFIVSSHFDYAIDAIFGIVISIIVMIFAIKMIVDNFKTLVYGEKTDEEKNCILAILNNCDKIKRVDEIILHDYGFANKIGTATVKFDENLTISDAESIATTLKTKIAEESGCDVTISLSASDNQ